MSEKLVNRQRWEPPALRELGSVGAVLQFPGVGKVSIELDDMGDPPRKPQGQEMQ